MVYEGKLDKNGKPTATPKEGYSWVDLNKSARDGAVKKGMEPDMALEYIPYKYVERKISTNPDGDRNAVLNALHTIKGRVTDNTWELIKSVSRDELFKGYSIAKYLHVRDYVNPDTGKTQNVKRWVFTEGDESIDLDKSLESKD